MPVLLVVKRDNSVELFDRNKLIKGLSSAVKKRPVSIEDVNRIVDTVESCYANNMQNQITSAEIGDIVLKSLKEMDQVAYVRFASVYREFADVETFVSELMELVKKDKK